MNLLLGWRTNKLVKTIIMFDDDDDDDDDDSDDQAFTGHKQCRGLRSLNTSSWSNNAQVHCNFLDFNQLCSSSLS